MYIILTKTCRNPLLLTQKHTYVYCDPFTGVCFREIWCQLPEDGKVNSNEICRSKVQDCMHKLQNSAFVGVTLLIYVAKLMFILSTL